LLCLITAPTLASVGVALEVIDILTATATLTRTWANMLQTSGQTIGRRAGTTQGLGSGLDLSMFAANCAPISVTQLPIVPIFAAVPSNPLLTLLLGMFLLRLGSPTPTQINTSHLILQL
jgi:tetrahydromethanopterin S-methyltransferase subunit G